MSWLIERPIHPGPWAVVLFTQRDATGGFVIVSDNPHRENCTIGGWCDSHQVYSVGWRTTPRRGWFGARDYGVFEALDIALKWRAEKLEREAEAGRIADTAKEMADAIAAVARIAPSAQ